MDDGDKQSEEWESLYAAIRAIADTYGKEDWLGRGDYLLVDDNYGTPSHKLILFNPDLLNPALIGALQQALQSYQGWEIVVAIDVPGTEDTWPRMGLTIYPDRVEDDLRREYLPARFQELRF